MFFTKMHGCGNDYVYVDGSKEIIEQSKKSEIARIVSDRHFGIGSDGLIFRAVSYTHLTLPTIYSV